MAFLKFEEFIANNLTNYPKKEQETITEEFERTINQLLSANLIEKLNKYPELYKIVQANIQTSILSLGGIENLISSDGKVSISELKSVIKTSEKNILENPQYKKYIVNHSETPIIETDNKMLNENNKQLASFFSNISKEDLNNYIKSFSSEEIDTGLKILGIDSKAIYSNQDSAENVSNLQRVIQQEISKMDSTTFDEKKKEEIKTCLFAALSSYIVETSTSNEKKSPDTFKETFDAFLQRSKDNNSPEIFQILQEISNNPDSIKELYEFSQDSLKINELLSYLHERISEKQIEQTTEISETSELNNNSNNKYILPNNIDGTNIEELSKYLTQNYNLSKEELSNIFSNFNNNIKDSQHDYNLFIKMLNKDIQSSSGNTKEVFEILSQLYTEEKFNKIVSDEFFLHQLDEVIENPEQLFEEKIENINGKPPSESIILDEPLITDGFPDEFDVSFKKFAEPFAPDLDIQGVKDSSIIDQESHETQGNLGSITSEGSITLDDEIENDYITEVSAKKSFFSRQIQKILNANNPFSKFIKNAISKVAPSLISQDKKLIGTGTNTKGPLTTLASSVPTSPNRVSSFDEYIHVPNQDCTIEENAIAAMKQPEQGQATISKTGSLARGTTQKHNNTTEPSLDD